MLSEAKLPYIIYDPRGRCQVQRVRYVNKLIIVPRPQSTHQENFLFSPALQNMSSGAWFDLYDLSKHFFETLIENVYRKFSLPAFPVRRFVVARTLVQPIRRLRQQSSRTKRCCCASARESLWFSSWTFFLIASITYLRRKKKKSPRRKKGKDGAFEKNCIFFLRYREAR